MLAGHKLLLADDSVTIQKVVDLTFADEGVQVVAVSNGLEAIEKLREVSFDIVLADVFMPGMTGYEVCEYMKRDQELKRIPVMLLVGSFEPFDEVEARRVGADDILTKPFESIRRLIERVGTLLGGQPVQDAAKIVKPPTIEETLEVEATSMNTAELEISTADTRPLSPLTHSLTNNTQSAPAQTTETNLEDTMESYPAGDSNSEGADSGEALLDLDDLEPARAVAAGESILDIEFETAPAVFATATAFAPSRSPLEPEAAAAGQFPESQAHFVGPEAAPEVPFVVPGAGEVQLLAQGRIGPNQLSPEAIDQIARRVVEYMSDKVVQEIAWEVVPQLAELLIKQKLEEKESLLK